MEKAKDIACLLLGVALLGVFLWGIISLVTSEHFSAGFTQECDSLGEGLYVYRAPGFYFEFNIARAIEGFSSPSTDEKKRRN